MLAAKRLDKKVLTTEDVLQMHLTVESPLTLNAPTGTYMVCCHPRSARNLDLSNDPLLVEAAKSALSEHLGARVVQFFTNFQNTLSFARVF